MAAQTQVKIICGHSSSSKPVEGWYYLTEMPAEEQSKAFEHASTGMDRTWEDVEEVMSISDFLQVMLRRLRVQSWNHRHA